MTLRKQETLLIEYLIKKRTWVRSDELSSFLNVSIRTLRNRIKEINRTYELIDSSNYGYRLNDYEIAQSIVNEQDSSEKEYSVKGRRNKIIKKLIQANEGISIYTLADELYVSDSTIQGDMQAIKKIMSSYQIELVNTNDMVSVKSDDRSNYLKVMSSIVYQEANDGFMSFDVLRDMFPHYDVLTLRKIIVEELAKNDLLTNDYSLISIILHFCIGFELADKFELSRHYADDIDDVQMKATKDIITRINQECDFYIKESELHAFCTIIHQYTKDASDTSPYAAQGLNKEIYDFVVELTDLFYEKHFVDIRNDVFISGLTLHLEQLLANCKRQLKNPLHAAIRNGSPVIYELAVIAAKAIQEKWPDLKLNEHEISYIAIHIGLAFEKKEREKINIALINLNYNNSSSIIAQKIKDAFGTNIKNLSIYSDESEITDADVDLVVATMQTKKRFPNCVNISLFVSKEDEEKLYEAINKTVEYKINNEKKSIYDAFSKHHFIYE